MLRGSLLAGLVWAGLLGGAQAQYVTVGGDDMDACSSMGEVVGLKRNGDNFLAVRAGPGSNQQKLDEIHMGDAVYICDERNGWMGIVYGKGRCGVTSPIVPRQTCNGPCRSGWVSARFIEVTAG